MVDDSKLPAVLGAAGTKNREGRRGSARDEPDGISRGDLRHHRFSPRLSACSILSPQFLRVSPCAQHILRSEVKLSLRDKRNPSTPKRIRHHTLYPTSASL